MAAVRTMIEETDKQWRRRSKKYGTPEMPVAQVALVCLDAETGEVKALVGGRNYGTSQYDHAMSHRDGVQFCVDRRDAVDHASHADHG